MNAFKYLARIAMIILVSISGIAMLEAQKGNFKVAFITFKPEGFHNGFWDSLQAGARKAASELGIHLEFRGLEPDYVDKRVEGQSRLFDHYIEQGYQAIVFAPSDRLKMAVPVRKAAVQGLKVVAVDSSVESPLLSGIFATNNYEGGRQAAREMGRLLQGRGKVLLLAHPTRDNKATRDRELAFAAELAESFPRIKLVSADRTGGATLETDLKAARSLLHDFPDVNGVYGISGSGLEAFMMVLEELKLNGKVALVGWDSGPAVLEGLKRGTVSAILQQNPEKMAYEGVKAAWSAARGQGTPLMVDTGTVLVTRANMDSPEVLALIRPDNRGWVQ